MNTEIILLEDRDPVTFPSGVVYTGQWLGNVCCGYGVQVWPNGMRYEGDWFNNEA